jgi:hypothetical protein
MRDAGACCVVLSGMRFLSLLRVRNRVACPGLEMLCCEGLIVSSSSSDAKFKVNLLT